MKQSNLLTFTLIAFFLTDGTARILAAGSQTRNSPDQNPNSNGGMTLADLFKTVQENNPALKASHSKWEMMKARVPQAKAWEDPRLNVTSVAGRFVTIMPESFMNQSAMLEQEIPVSGKNLSRSRVAVAEAFQAYQELRRAEIDAMVKAKIAVFKLSQSRALLQINQKNRELLTQMVASSRAKYEVGSQSQADLLMAQTNLVRLDENQLMIERELSERQSELNVLMNRPVSAPVCVSDNGSDNVVDVPTEQIEAIAMRNRPEIAIALASIEAEKAKLQLGKRQQISDPAISVTAQRYNETKLAVNEVDVGVSFPLPWVNHSKYSAAILEAEKSLEMVRREYDSTCAGLNGMLRDQVKKIDTARKNYRLYHDKIEPLASQTLKTTLSGYETGQSTFLELITAQRTVQEVETGVLDSLTTYKIAVAELEAITGTNPNPFQNQSK